MNKPDSLRKALTAALPDLLRNPDRLAIFIDQGRVVSRMAPPPAFPAPSFEYRYRLNVVIQDMTEHPDAVMVTVLMWLHEHQPDLLQRHDREPVKFDADIISADTIDLSIELDLSESVRAADRVEGGFDLTHIAEPPAIEELENVPRWTPLQAIYLDGECVAGTPDDR